MQHRVVIVGGSLAGLSIALAIAPHVARVTVIERSPAKDNGGGLGVDRPLLAAATGRDAGGPTGVPAVAAGRREITTWAALRAWLMREVHTTPAIQVVERRSVVALQPMPAGVTAIDADGDAYPADLVIGADGYRSTVRRFVDPERPTARYAGYLVWRALVPEAAAGGRARDRWSDGVESADGQLFVVYAVPGPDGSITPGARQFTFGWYDPRWNGVLRQLGILDGEVVLRSLRADEIPADLRDELRRSAARWPQPWSDVAGAAVATSIFGTPISEYVPDRLVRGRVAIAGDAAHVAPPILGAGFEMALLDAIALRDALRAEPAPERALAAYERARLADARAFVARGAAWSRSFAAAAAGR